MQLPRTKEEMAMEIRYFQSPLHNSRTCVFIHIVQAVHVTIPPDCIHRETTRCIIRSTTRFSLLDLKFQQAEIVKFAHALGTDLRCFR